MNSIKPFLSRAFQSDHALEILFSSLRWFFLIMSAVVFYVQYTANPIQDKLYLFLILVTFGFIYMGISDYFLHRAPKDSFKYTVMTKGAPIFDYIAFVFLIALTGGTTSPLFPIAFLIILHVAVYWKFIGAMTAAILLIFGYSLVFLFQGYTTTAEITHFLSNVLFLFFMGFIGGIIVTRERKHFSEKTELEDLAKKDYLTNLFNHRSFQEHLKRALIEEKDFHLVLGDIDGFKKVNDQYGHVVGDQVLQKIGSILKESIPHGVGDAYRYGGEEFAIILYSQESTNVASLLADIKEKVSKEIYTCEKINFSVTMSFGSCKKYGDKPNQLVAKVDKLLYQAKQQGRNCIVNSN